MYLEIDEGFSEHPKTLKLCSIMADPLAGFYLFNLWKWACRSCQDGNLRGLGVYEIEEAARYNRHDGKLYSAMADSGFLDFDDDGNLTKIHNWMKRTGLAIKKMSDKAEENRKRRADAKAKHDAEKYENRTAIEVESYRNRTGTILSQTRPDQTRPDQTSQERDSARDLCGAEHVVPPANEYGKPTPYNVVSMYLAIRAETIGGAKKLFAQPQPSDVEKAASWLSSMTPEDSKDLEPAIRLACRHVKDGAQGWTHPDMVKVGFLFGCIVRGWPDLREELHECAPKPRVSDRNGEEKPKPRSTPVKFI